VLDLKRFINDKEPVGELKITFQKFYRVAGSSTQNKGVTPDVKLPSALAADQYGESSRPNALPWDVIRSASFQKTADINGKVLTDLNKAYQDRVKSDVSLKRYIMETEELKKSLAETKISLNEAKRKKEMEEAQQKKSVNDKLDTKVVGKEGVPAEGINMDDEYLREGLLVLTNLVSRRIG
jgi:carboxyl-terminal processing protease